MVSQAQKQVVIDELKTVLADATIVVVADYRGLGVADLTQLRRSLRGANVTVTVAKNTLAKRAIAGTALEPLSVHLKGPTALVVGRGDQVTVVKTLKEFLKKNKKPNELRGGLLEGAAISAAEVDELATMPSLDELRGKLLMCIASPLIGLAQVLQSPSVSLVRALDQIAEQKQAKEG